MFDWDEHNIEHIAKHGVEPEEVEEAMTDTGAVADGAYNVRSEKRYALIGATEAGRILYVTYTLRGERFRPITARDTNRAQKRRYRR